MGPVPVPVLIPVSVSVSLPVFAEGKRPDMLGSVTTGVQIYPGNSLEIVYTVTDDDGVSLSESFVAEIVIDPNDIRFHECREDNNRSNAVQCGHPPYLP